MSNNWNISLLSTVFAAEVVAKEADKTNEIALTKSEKFYGTQLRSDT